MKKSLFIDKRQEAYGAFFSDSFGKDAFLASDKAPVLAEPIFDLAAAWRSASYAGALPASIPSSIKHFHDGFVNAETTATGILQYSHMILAKLSRELPDLTADPVLQRALQKKIVTLTSEIAEANSTIKQELDSVAVWQQFLDLTPFFMGIHGTMRLVYLAVYGAYENFLVRTISIALDGKNIRVTDQNFKKDFRAAFGDMIEEAWFAEDIRVARLIRHSLIHAGGRVTSDLQNCKIPLIVHEGSLNVFPAHVSDLYDTLKVPALRIMKTSCFQGEASKQVPSAK